MHTRHLRQTVARTLVLFGFGMLVLALAACSQPEPVTELIVSLEPPAGGSAATASRPEPDKPVVLVARAAAIDVARHGVWMSADSSNPARMDITRTLPPNDRGEWIVHRVPVRKGALDNKKRSDVTLKVDEQGAIYVVQSVEAAENVFTEFNPPMLMLPAEMKAGQTLTSTFHMVVRPLGRPDEVSTEGDATNTVECLGHETISTPSGTYETVKIRSTLKALMGNVEVENVTVSWFAPQHGIVAETRTQRVVAMGLQVRSAAESWVLAPGAPAATAPTAAR